MIRVIAIVMGALSFIAGAQCAESDYRADAYAVIYDGAIAMEKYPIEKGNLYPWLKNSGVIIWSCGFARITYKEFDAKEFLRKNYNPRVKRSSFYYLTGEWCEVADVLMETSGRAAHLIAYRKWGGKKYIMSYANVYTDNEGVPFIADRRFVQVNDLETLVTPIAQGRDNGACFYPERVPEYLLDEPSGMVSDVDGHRCATKGVRLKDFVLPANNSLQADRER